MDQRPLTTRFARAIALLLAGMAAALSFTASAAREWNIAALASLPSGRPFANALAVNNRGDVVGFSYVYDAAINSNRGYAVLWQNGAVVNLGEGSASAVNDRGTIAGSVVGGLSLWKDGRWSRVGGGLGGWPFGLNKFEDIAGWAIGGLSHAYVYRDGVLFDLGTLGGSDSAANATNDRGQVVGYAMTPNGNYHAFLYENGAMNDLGTLGGGVDSRAHDINNHGTIVGTAQDAAGNWTAFIHDGVMRPLFSPSGCCAVARAINDHGAVVGTIDGNASFLFEDGTLTRLESIPAVRAAGWTQLIPSDINDRGWIVGMGRIGPLQPPATQEWKAFVLKPGR